MNCKNFPINIYVKKANCKNIQNLALFYSKLSTVGVQQKQKQSLMLLQQISKRKKNKMFAKKRTFENKGLAKTKIMCHLRAICQFFFCFLNFPTALNEIPLTDTFDFHSFIVFRKSFMTGSIEVCLHSKITSVLYFRTHQHTVDRSSLLSFSLARQTTRTIFCCITVRTK